MRSYDTDLYFDLLERDLHKILSDVCLKHGITIREACAGDKKHTAVIARRAMYMHLYVNMNWSYSDIGRLFGIDHTTVIAQLNRHIT